MRKLPNEAIARRGRRKGEREVISWFNGNLRNEPIALDAPVQSSEFKVQSSSELPNEPIPASGLSEISNLRSQMAGKLRNEANNGGEVSQRARKPESHAISH
jgi:hypothetical protein